MSIVSFSLFPEDTKRIDEAAALLEVKSKSEVIRSSINCLIEELTSESKLHGHVHAAIIVLHDEKASSTISHIRHKFEAVIRTQMHCHFTENKCIETIIVEGNGEKVRKLLVELRKIKKVSSVKLVVT